MGCVVRYRTRLQELRRGHGAPSNVITDPAAVHPTDTDGAGILIQIAHELQEEGSSRALVHVPGTEQTLGKHEKADGEQREREYHRARGAQRRSGP